MADQIRAHVFVTGTVQGVFFRASIRDAASERGIDGWVKNLRDGRVEAVFEGNPDAIDDMVDWCHTGSDGAVVEDVIVEFEPPDGIDGFEIRR